MTPGGRGELPALVDLRPRTGRLLSAYGVVLVVQTVVGLVQTTGLLAALGPAVWQVLTIAQTAGLLATTVSTAGLVSFGASVVALEEARDQPNVYLSTFRARAVISLIIAALLILCVAWVSPTAKVAGLLTGLSALLLGMTGSWYFIGRGQPARWLRLEVLPIAAGSILGVGLAILWENPMGFAAAYLAGTASALLLTARSISRDRPTNALPVKSASVFTFIRRYRGLMVASVAGGVNGHGPALLYGAAGSPVLAAYLLLDRMVKYAVAALAPFLQVTQRWVALSPPQERRRRGLKAIGLASAVAILVGTVFALLGGLGARALSAGSVSVTQAQVNAFSVLVVILIVTQVNALAVLVPLGGQRQLARSTGFGAVMLVVLGLVVGHGYGPMAVIWAVIAVEAAILMVQLTAVVAARAPLDASN